jgi:3-oxoacid CoA-transferase
MKLVPRISADEAARLVKDGDVLMAGGFGMTGAPVHLLHALAASPVRELTYIGNNVGEAGLGAGRLLRNGQIKMAIGSYFTSNPEAVEAAQSGAVEIQLLPQGSLAESIRAGGAGLGGFYTETAAGTVIAEGFEIRRIGGKEYVFVPALTADIAFIRAWRADTAGNLVYRMTEQNFNKSMATAARTVVAEVEKIVPVGELDPNEIHTPCCFVDYLVEAHTTVEDLGSSASVSSSIKRIDDRRMAIARRALAELKRGDIVNLGIGIPTLIADLIAPDDGIIMHTENGMLGVGPEPASGGAMEYPVNAGKIPVTSLAGGSYFDSADSFAMIRGRHVDVAVMGGLQVDANANLANWAVPGKPLLGVGGAMDLAHGAKRLIVTMLHTNKDGSSKIVPEITLPLTAKGVVNVVITDLAVFRFDGGRLTLTECMSGATIEDIRARTDAKFTEDL